MAEKKTNFLIDKKQPILASFGFRKTNSHYGEILEMDIPKFATIDLIDLRKYECNSCSKDVKNNQGPSVHLKLASSYIEREFFLISRTSKETPRKT